MSQKGLSKIALLITIFILIVGGVVYSRNLKTSVHTQPKTDKTPEMVTQAFYDWYLSCIDEHFQNMNPNHSPHDDCPYEKNQNVSPKLYQNIGLGNDSDPIFCAQNTPKTAIVGTAKISGSNANLQVTIPFNTDVLENVSLELIAGEWKITNIQCLPHS